MRSSSRAQFRTPSRRRAARARARIALGAIVCTAAAGTAFATLRADGVADGVGVYVVQAGGLEVIDTANHHPTAGDGTPIHTTVAADGASRVTTSPDGTRTYVSRPGAGQVDVVSTQSDTVERSILVGGAPTHLALAPDGATLYAAADEGLLAIDLSTDTVSAPLADVAKGPIAITPDGATALVASTELTRIDLATGAATTIALPNGVATNVVVSPDGTLAYVSESTFFAGNVLVVDLATNAVSQTIPFLALPGAMAVAPDGNRLYVAVQATWIDTGYGAGFVSGRTVRVLDTDATSWIGQIDLGAGGTAFSLQNTGAGIAVTPDSAHVYITVPRIDSVKVANGATLAVVDTIVVGDAPSAIAIARDPDVAVPPPAVSASDDAGNTSTFGGVAIADVLANDGYGGFTATTGHVDISASAAPEASAAGIALDPATGTVHVAPGAPVGTYTLGYTICDELAAANCASAVATVEVRAPNAIDAVDDWASAKPGQVAVANVLANDTLAGAPLLDAILTQLDASDPGLFFDPSAGKITLRATTGYGLQTLRYSACETSDPNNCDVATVTIDVTTLAIVANPDAATVSLPGTANAVNLLVNDTLDGGPVTYFGVAITNSLSSDPAITLESSGVISVAATAAVGTHTVDYQICETAHPANCAVSSATIEVTPSTIDAVDDSGRGSSRDPSTPIANVLANDRLAGAPASLAAVILTQVSSPTQRIRLDTGTGAVLVMRRTDPGIYVLVYRICEASRPANCDTANITIELTRR
jgi:DNA-binding beta-propeller fold protein YncE